VEKEQRKKKTEKGAHIFLNERVQKRPRRKGGLGKPKNEKKGKKCKGGKERRNKARGVRKHKGVSDGALGA